MFELTDLQCDSLMETFNIGVGRASKSLSLLLGCEAALSVPIIVQASPAEASEIVDPSLRQQQGACMVSRQFIGIEAEAVMIFQGPRENISALLNLPTQQASPSDARENVATKIATMISESCAAQIQDLVGYEIVRGPVLFFPSVPEQIFVARNDETNVMIIVKIDIALKRRGVTGHLLLSFSQAFANSLADGLDRLLSDSEEE